MAQNYDVNYEDERFQEVEADKNAALNEVDKTYGEMIGQSDKFYQAQIDASQQWADKQTQLQQEQTDFTIEQIEQQKAEAKKDYTKEQSGAYADWQKQSNQYGANAEAMAAQGMQNTGFSESSQVSMYNTYQNRVASARESYNRAVQNYDNAIKDARLQNNSVLAEIAYQALQQQLELSLQGFQYKNSLIIEQANKKQEVDNIHYQRYQDVLNQINTENALAEEVRQFNQNYDLQVKQFNEEIRQFNAEIARLKAQDEAENAYKIQQLELQKAQLEEEMRQFDKLHSSPVSDIPAPIVGKTPSSSGSEKSESISSKNSGGGSGKSGISVRSDGAEAGSSKFTGSTYSDAVAYMKSKGVSSANASSVMTKSEWTRRKTANSTSAHTKNYSSYQAYLADYVEYSIKSK